VSVIPDEAGRSRLRAGLERAHDQALERTRARAVGDAPRRTGEFAASLQTHRSGTVGSVYSDLPQAGAVERGANVGPRRGPHMAGAHVIARAGEHFPEHMAEALRGGG
jgi:hypothetical protein